VKVLMTADAVGGVLTYALELAGGLARRGVETVLAVAGPPPSREQRGRLDAAPLAAWHARPYALEWMEEPWEDVERMGAWLHELVEELEPDLVHLNGYVHGALELGPPSLVAGHSCVLSWHEAVRRRPAGAEWGRYREAVREGLAGADALVAPTRSLLAELVRLYRPRCPAEAIPNGMAAGALRPLPKERYVLGVGRAWDEAKNLGALERVAPLLSAPVLVAGEGSTVGRVGAERLRELYGHAAILAAPARYEPFGLVALEAALCGCALVLGDLPTYREVWEDAAVYVDPFEDDSLAEAVERLLADDLERERLGRAARRRALTFTRERMAAAYLDRYERLLSEVGRPVRDTLEIA
jgi:glycosyltransferase involved in cell wall biosynthesis